MQNYSSLYSYAGSISFLYGVTSPMDYTFEVFKLTGELLHTETGLSSGGSINPQWNFTDLLGNPVNDSGYTFSLTFSPHSGGPRGLSCWLVIDDRWTAHYIGTPSFSGITYFGQCGPDDPIRAISHANTNALRRLSQGANKMPESEVWRIVNRVAGAFGVNPAKYEKPRMYEEGRFEYNLGIYTVEYRKKGSDPINGLNYTRSFSLKATSSTTAVLVTYTHLEAWQP